MRPLTVLLPALVVLAGCGGGSSPVGGAADECGIESRDGSIVIDTSDNGTIDDVVCVLLELGASQAVAARIDGTRALDGVQTAELADAMLSWSYHPDSGLLFIVEQR